MTRAQLLRDAGARAARLKQLDNDVLGAYGDLQDAQARRAQARDIQEGDRQGRRLLAPYVQRQRDLQVEVDQKRRRWTRSCANDRNCNSGGSDSEKGGRHASTHSDQGESAYAT